MKILMKELFTRANLETNIYTAIILGSLVLMSFTSCSIIEINKQEEDYRDMEELQPLYEKCERFEYKHDPNRKGPMFDLWMECIMDEQERVRLLKHTA